MSGNAKKLREDALALPEQERELLAAELLDSLERAPDWERAWASECERRLEDVRSGRVQPVAWSVVKSSLRARLRNAAAIPVGTRHGQPSGDTQQRANSAALPTAASAASSAAPRFRAGRRRRSDPIDLARSDTRRPTPSRAPNAPRAHRAKRTPRGPNEREGRRCSVREPRRYDRAVLHVTTVRAPEVLLAFAREVRAQRLDVHELIGADLDVRLLAQLEGSEPIDVTDAELAGELSYGRWVPFEVVPFAWQGGDALHYGHLVMAEELGGADWPCVSFAPEDLVVSWLGEGAAHALANLLATTEAHDDGDACAAERARLTARLGLPEGEVLKRGARSGRRAVPDVPPGYRHVVGGTGVGVLAPERSFADLDVASVPFEALEDRAAAALADGHAATALQLLALQRQDADGAGERAACEQMIAVYEALGRPVMARRVEAHLRLSIFG